MHLESFLTELLYDHDCVIVPDFGGLVANYRPARLNRRSHVIFPPSKHVGFNRNLTHNDGLLANHIAQSLGIAYKDAQAQLAATVAEYHVQLASNGRINWKNLGVFFKDKNGQLQFIPEDQENFLLEAFGLTPLQLQPVQQIAAPVEEVKETPIIPLPAAKRNFPLARIAAIMAIPLAIGAALMVRNQMSHEGFSLSSINPFQTTEIKSNYHPSSPESMMLADHTPLTPGMVKWHEAHPSETRVRFNFLTDEPSEDGIEVVLLEEQKFSGVLQRGDFAIIGGAFMFEDNADKFVQELQAKGFPAKRVGMKRNLFLVAYGTYATQEQAREALQKIKSNENKAAWLKHD